MPVAGPPSANPFAHTVLRTDPPSAGVAETRPLHLFVTSGRLTHLYSVLDPALLIQLGQRNIGIQTARRRLTAPLKHLLVRVEYLCVR